MNIQEILTAYATKVNRFSPDMKRPSLEVVAARRALGDHNYKKSPLDALSPAEYPDYVKRYIAIIMHYIGD
jgi:hypothetical protein